MSTLPSLNAKIEPKSVFSTVATQTDHPPEIKSIVQQRKEVSIQASLEFERHNDDEAPRKS